MTYRTLCCAVRSLHYRRRLARDLPAIEARVRAGLQSHGLTAARLGGLMVQMDDDSIVIRPTSSLHRGQLRLPGMNPNQVKS